MIKLTTDCNKCIHNKLCKYKFNASGAMNKLKNMQYGKGPNDDYDWDTIMNSMNVDITFSCPDFDESYSTKTLNGPGKAIGSGSKVYAC